MDKDECRDLMILLHLKTIKLQFMPRAVRAESKWVATNEGTINEKSRIIQGVKLVPKSRSRAWRKENVGPKGILAALHGSRGSHPTFEVTLPKSSVQSPVLQKSSPAEPPQHNKI